MRWVTHVEMATGDFAGNDALSDFHVAGSGEGGEGISKFGGKVNVGVHKSSRAMWCLE